MNAILVIDKPSGMTSHDVVNRVRRIIRERSVGHLGTLDPLATGVLPLMAGNLTRLAQFYTSSTKTYEGVIRFGFATDTYDAKGEPTTPQQEVTLTLEAVKKAAERFHGVIQQTPPPFSAKKVNGVPAYKLARKHQEVKLEPVQIEIKDFEILGVENDCASFRATVTSGTYMRSVAHEMGQEMGCGGHLAALRRTALGGFAVEDAHTLEALHAAAHAGTLEELAIHPRKILPEIPAVTVNEDVVAKIRSGRPVNLPELSKSRLVKVFAGQRELIAIATRVAGTLFHAKIVLSGDATPELAGAKGK
ncbi:MAG TPA: tRNA pseudouridine(55) synthase TruB [Terriglobales bacterium]|jgi:tRNA pseudouridine55 synthase|nr:tRNA pseudouridine(55) synthase TruB [Terriglobales bacterium]